MENNLKPKIIVIGSSNTDMIVKVPKIPSPGETILGNEFFVIQGGKGANQAVATARAGGDVVFIASIGDDAFGQQAIEAYQKEGINTKYIKRVDGVATGVALINVSDTSGENSISVAPGANGHLLPDDIETLEQVFDGASIVLMQLEIPLITVEHAALVAAKKNIPVILNPAPAQTLPSSLLEKVTLLTPNEHEAALLAGIPDEKFNVEETAMSLQEKGVKGVVLTLGEKGAYFTDGKEKGTVDGIKVKAVDTTAAGDTFNGYLAVNLAKGKTLAESINLANKAAAVSVTRLGAQPSIPFANEINSQLN